MKGTMVYLNPGDQPEIIEMDRAPTLEELQKRVGGYLEYVPHFDVWEHEGTPHPCIAYCDEDGKHKALPVNVDATQLWLKLNPELRRADGTLSDFLVGPILILFGDRRFMGWYEEEESDA